MQFNDYILIRSPHNWHLWPSVHAAMFMIINDRDSPSEIYLELKSRLQTSVFLVDESFWHFAQGMMICAVFLKAPSTELGKRYFTRFQFKVYLYGLSILLRPQGIKFNQHCGSPIYHDLSLDILKIIRDSCHFQVCDEETTQDKAQLWLSDIIVQ